MPGADLTLVKAQLRITTTTSDALLSLYLSAVTQGIEAEIGPLEVRTFAESVNTRASALLLSNRPLQSIVSIIPTLTTWPSYDATDVAFDAKAGSVWRTDLGTLAGSWVVTYTAGNVTVGDDVKLAQLLIVQDLWESTRGGSRRPGQGASDPADALSNPYEMRRRVREVLRSARLDAGGIA